ncbi:hypothetical protein A2U01_0102474, partial [Trifolium medium]|nr:hypothetical protein [Trifolium medium]
MDSIFINLRPWWLAVAYHGGAVVLARGGVS